MIILSVSEYITAIKKNAFCTLSVQTSMADREMGGIEQLEREVGLCLRGPTYSFPSKISVDIRKISKRYKNEVGARLSFDTLV